MLLEIMNNFASLILSLVAGLLLGCIFFAGLWWTIKESVTCKHPALLFAGSLILRTGSVLAGFYFVCGTHWERLVLCLIGFVVARLAVTYLTRLKQSAQLIWSEEAHLAPKP